MTEQILNSTILDNLRKQGLIEDTEIAIQVGDRLLAENVLTKDRRILSVDISILTESGPRILKG